MNYIAEVPAESPGLALLVTLAKNRRRSASLMTDERSAAASEAYSPEEAGSVAARGTLKSTFQFDENSVLDSSGFTLIWRHTDSRVSPARTQQRKPNSTWCERRVVRVQSRCVDPFMRHGSAESNAGICSSQLGVGGIKVRYSKE